jgi:hypothetical protein
MDQRGPEQHQGGASWIIGLVLIALGVSFLLQQAGYLDLSGNWWAIFIYVAAFGSAANAWRSWRSAGRFGPASTTSLVWALVLVVVATILFFGLSWSAWWPLILVAVGAGIVVGYVLGDRAPSSSRRD